MPYLLPENMDNMGFSSVCVHYPDAPEFKQALLGSLLFFAKWTAWDRDKEHRGKQAAALWTIAHDMTVQTWNDPCGGTIGDTMNCEELKLCIQEVLNDMAINVTVNNQCCDGSTGGSASLYCIGGDGQPIISPFPVTDNPSVPLPPDMDVPPVIVVPDNPTAEDPPPDGFSDWETYDTEACKAANSLVEYLYQVCLRYEELMVDDIPNIAAMFVIIVNIVTVGFTSLFSAELLYNIASFTTLVQQILDIPAQIFGNMAQAVDDNRQEWVCYLYGLRGNVGDWETELISKLFEAVSAQLADETAAGALHQLIGMLLPPYMGLNMLYGVVTYDGNFVGVDCLCASDLNIVEDFSAIATLSEHWTTVRGTIVGGAADLNSSDIAYSTLVLSQTDLVNKWNGTPALYNNVSITFDWRATQVDGLTATFKLTGQQEVGVTSTLYQSTLGAANTWRTVTLSPLTLNFTSAAGLNILEWRISGTSSRQIIQIDNIVITGDTA